MGQVGWSSTYTWGDLIYLLGGMNLAIGFIVDISLNILKHI